MSYHQWLSGTPKYHLTSAATGAASVPKSTKTHYRPDFSLTCVVDPVIEQTPLFTSPAPLNYDTSLVSFDFSQQAAVQDFADYAIDYWAAEGLPITPPWQPSDVSFTDNLHSQAYPCYQAFNGDGGLVEMSNLENAPPPLQTTGIVAPARTSRVQCQDNPSSQTDAQLNSSKAQQTLLSPPSTPQGNVKVSSPAPQGSLPTEQRTNIVGTAARTPCCVYTDPMMQTSTVPHYWSTNFTVLRADTSTVPGNVVSPTCMVGLPFGGMVEMTLPHPDGEIKDPSAVE